MHRTEPSHLQSLALQLSEKFSTLVDHNERIMEIRQGTFFSYQKKQGNNTCVILLLDRLNNAHGTPHAICKQRS